MARILRCVDPTSPTSVRLNLVDGTSFIGGRGLDIGTVGVNRSWIRNTPTGEWRGPVMMRVPLIIPRQANWAAIQALKTALNTELDRKKNGLEFRPDGAAASWVFLTYMAEIPPIFRGQDAVDLERLLFDPVELVLNIPRHPRPISGPTTYL